MRALAQRSAQAARKVKTLIGASVEQVIQLIDEMARGTREHTAGFTGIARSVDEIGSATRRSGSSCSASDVEPRCSCTRRSAACAW